MFHQLPTHGKIAAEKSTVLPKEDSYMHTLDKAFKKILSDPYILCEFIRMFLPKLADEHKISQSDIKIENTEFLSSDLKIKRPDVLFRVRTKDREAFVYILIEHQSYKDHNMALRIYDYTGRIWTNYVVVAVQAKRKKRSGR